MNETLKTKLYLAVSTLSLLSAGSAFASDLSSQREQLSAAMREKLTPLVEAAIQEHCGEDCPSFRIDPVFRKTAPPSELEDLGFSKPAESDAAPEIQSVSVSVLIQDKVPAKARESLRKILSNRMVNEANVPVSVRLAPLDAVAPLMAKRATPDPVLASAQEKLALVKASIWPVCLILLALFALYALAKVLRHRLEMRKPLETAEASDSNVAAGQALEVELAGSPASELLSSRSEDLQWLLEDAASRGDAALLQRALGAFSAREITSRIQLSTRALSALAALPPTAAASAQSAEAARLLPELNRAHWRRLEEQADRLARLGRIPAERLAKLFTRVRTMGSRAAMLSALPEERWPELIARLSSEERVELGLRLADYSAAQPEDRVALTTQLAHQLHELDNSGAERSEAALESFSLYLSEKEGQKLWQDLSARSLGRDSSDRLKPVSIESVLSGLDPAAATEICARLDVGTLSLVLEQVTDETRARILQGLPKGLQSRLSADAQRRREAPAKAPAEAESIRARATLIEAYRSFGGAGSRLTQ